MSVVIAGPGRSGTSLLVRILRDCGFEVAGAGWDEDAQAGLESRVSFGPDDVVFKDPWLFEYVHSLDPLTIRSISSLIIPLRRRSDVVASRLVQDRGARIEADADPVSTWAWRTGERGIAGGVVVGMSAADVSTALSEALWDLVEFAIGHDIPTTFIHFPRFAEDFEYLWSTLGDVMGRVCSREDAQQSWNSNVDLNAVRLRSVAHPDLDHLRTDELVGIIERLRKKLAEQETVAEGVARERDGLLVERGGLVAERDWWHGQFHRLRERRAVRFVLSNVHFASRFWVWQRSRR